MPSHQSGERVFWLMQEGGGVLSLFACFGALVCFVMLGMLKPERRGAQRFHAALQP